MTGPGDNAGLASYVIPQFHAQGEVSLEDKVGAASEIPGELSPVIRVDVLANNRRGVRGAAEAVDPQPEGDERLHTAFDPQIADVIEGD